MTSNNQRKRLRRQTNFTPFQRSLQYGAFDRKGQSRLFRKALVLLDHVIFSTGHLSGAAPITHNCHLIVPIRFQEFGTLESGENGITGGSGLIGSEEWGMKICESLKI